MTAVAAEYTRRYESYLQALAENLQRHMTGFLVGTKNVDRVIARAKAPASFANKADKKDDKGNPKYLDPLNEIQDQVGARVIVFYKSDVDAVSAVVSRYFQAIEQRTLIPESESEFGYIGQHFVLPMPADVIPTTIQTTEVPRFFELQIKTLFQHAWSEANHDLGYKAKGSLTKDQKRLMAFTAAQAWGADRIFDELHAELSRP